MKRRLLFAAAVVSLFLMTTNGCGSGSGSSVIESTGTVNLNTVQSQVFNTTCAVTDCHVGPDAPFGLDLSAGQTAQNTINVESEEVEGLMRVEPFNPQDSYLYMKLVADPRIEGDPMPADADPLSPGQIALIASWIEQGAE